MNALTWKVRAGPAGAGLRRALVHILTAAAIGGQLVAPGAGAGVASRLVAALALAPRILQEVKTISNNFYTVSIISQLYMFLNVFCPYSGKLSGHLHRVKVVLSPWYKILA